MNRVWLVKLFEIIKAVQLLEDDKLTDLAPWSKLERDKTRHAENTNKAVAVF